MALPRYIISKYVHALCLLYLDISLYALHLLRCQTGADLSLISFPGSLIPFSVYWLALVRSLHEYVGRSAWKRDEVERKFWGCWRGKFWVITSLPRSFARGREAEHWDWVDFQSVGVVFFSTKPPPIPYLHSTLVGRPGNLCHQVSLYCDIMPSIPHYWNLPHFAFVHPLY